MPEDKKVEKSPEPDPAYWLDERPREGRPAARMVFLDGHPIARTGNGERP